MWGVPVGEPGVGLLLVESADGGHIVVGEREVVDVDVGAQRLGVGALCDERGASLDDRSSTR